MMRIWRRLGVDKLLKSAYLRGTVLSGISAGSICWFDSGHSDSLSFYNPRHGNTSTSPGSVLSKEYIARTTAAAPATFREEEPSEI